MDMFWSFGLIIIFFLMLYGNYGAFACMVKKWSRKPIKKKVHDKYVLVTPELTLSEKLGCFVPLYQSIIVRESLYYGAGPFGIMSIVSAVLIILRLLNVFVLTINSYVMFFTAIGMWIGFALHLLVYSIITADCAKMYGFSMLTVILCFLFPYWACWYIKNNVPTKMRDMYKEETFSEHKSDTVIKQKHN